ncbi:hypothetical protein MNBD_PLANCTO02-2327 [hydrothermal vent metagenome]|uniref:Soluble ligand binding domain-containing protein n=1 Tax=hydrothermal vent metagenome TaxID=652676 RepID=A0A3B1DPV0_9ZZZZ
MLFKQNLFLTYFVTGILLLFVTTVSVAQSMRADFNKPAFKQPASKQASQVKYFAIMGEVVHPGVYELKSSSPFLSNLVRISGGLTKNATGRLRIIRRGRSGQQAYFTPSLNMTLQPGDVVIADAKRIQKSTHKTVTFSHQQNTNADKPKQEHVQIGFINLLKRPVVVKIRKDYATVPQLIQLLGQPAKMIKKVRVILGKRQREKTGSLPNCSLLIFEKPVSSPKNLPDLPATLNAQQMAHAGPIGIEEPDPPQSALTPENENSSGDANDVILKGPTLFPDDVDNTGNNKNRTNNNIDSTDDNSIQYSDIPQVLILPAPSSTNNIVATPESETESHLIVESDIPSQPTETPAPPLELIPPLELAPTMMAEKKEAESLDEIASTMSEGDFADIEMEEQAIAKTEPTSNAITYTLGLLLIVGGGIFVWAVAPRKISAAVSQKVAAKNVVENVSQSAVAIEKVDGTKILEAMINDEMPIVMEQVILPVSLEFYGESTGHEKLRIDTAHKMAEPHFKPSIPQPVVQDETSQKASASTAPGLRIDPPINLEGSLESTRAPLVSRSASQTKKTFQK